MSNPTKVLTQGADTASREIRVFISSTFRDFNEERYLLATQVFPELNEWAKERGVELVEVDLRWGVTQEEAEVGHALEICLQEIENCKPYFIGMLGDSYGTLTPPQRDILKVSPGLLSKRQWLDGRIGKASYTELEIQHSLELLNDQEMKGRAFFYFRDAAYSTFKASQGEEGWISKDPQDRQRLEELKNKVRSSGHHLVEKGLDGPQAIITRIKQDLWELIDQQFPAGTKPDDIETEARMHKVYGDDRRKLYLGGQSMLMKLEKAINDNQGLILVTGESGFGKSSLVANWQELHSKTATSDMILCHHLGCGNEACEAPNVVKRFLRFAHQILNSHGTSQNEDHDGLPSDWWSLVSLVNQRLKDLSAVAIEGGFRFIWIIDSLDRLPEDSQNSLPWIPNVPPENIHIVVASLPCAALHVLLERKYRRIRIKELTTKEKENIIDNTLKRYSRSLAPNLKTKIIEHYLSHSPLFLRMLLDELRKAATFDGLEAELNTYLASDSVPEFYEKILSRLERDFTANDVKLFLTAMWASRTGLSEPDLLEVTGLSPMKLFGIRLSLGESLLSSSGRMIFAHDFVRSAAENRYLKSERERHAAHERILNWQRGKPVWDRRKLAELPWQAMKADKPDQLRSIFFDPDIVVSLIDLWGAQGVYGLISLSMPSSYNEILCRLTNFALKHSTPCASSDISQFPRAIDAISDLLEYAGLTDENYLHLRRAAFRHASNRISNRKVVRVRAFKRLLDAYYWSGRHRSLCRGRKVLYDLQCRSTGSGSVDSIIALVDLINAKYLCYEYPDVLDLATYTIPLAKEVLGEGHPSFLLLLQVYGRVSLDIGDYPRAIGLLCYATEGFYVCYGAEHWQTVNTLQHFGQALDATRPLYQQVEISLAINRTCSALLAKSYRDNHPFLTNIRLHDSLVCKSSTLHKRNPIHNLMTFRFFPGKGMLGAIVKCYKAYLSFNGPKVDWFLLEAYSQEAVSASAQGKSQKAFALLYRRLHAAVHRLSTESPLRPMEILEKLDLRITTRLCKIAGVGTISQFAERPLLSRSHRAAYQLVNIFGNLTPSGLCDDSADLNSVLDLMASAYYWDPVWSGAYNWTTLDLFKVCYNLYSDHAELMQYPRHDLLLDYRHRGLRDISILCNYLLSHRLLMLAPDNFLVGQALYLAALVLASAGQNDSCAMLFRQLVIHRLRYCPDLKWSVEAAQRELYRVTTLRPGSSGNELEEDSDSVIDARSYDPFLWRMVGGRY